MDGKRLRRVFSVFFLLSDTASTSHPGHVADRPERNLHVHLLTCHETQSDANNNNNNKKEKNETKRNQHIMTIEFRLLLSSYYYYYILDRHCVSVLSPQNVYTHTCGIIHGYRL